MVRQGKHNDVISCYRHHFAEWSDPPTPPMKMSGWNPLWMGILGTCVGKSRLHSFQLWINSRPSLGIAIYINRNPTTLLDHWGGPEHLVAVYISFLPSEVDRKIIFFNSYFYRWSYAVNIWKIHLCTQSQGYEVPLWPPLALRWCPPIATPMWTHRHNYMRAYTTYISNIL